MEKLFCVSGQMTDSTMSRSSRLSKEAIDFLKGRDEGALTPPVGGSWLSEQERRWDLKLLSAKLYKSQLSARVAL